MTGNTTGGSSHPETMAAAEVTMPGRHRPHGPDAWTPVVPRRAGGNHRHRPGPDKIDPAAVGAFPPPRGEQPDARAAFPAARGTLPQVRPDFLAAPLPQPQNPARATPADAFRPVAARRDTGVLPQNDAAFRPPVSRNSGVLPQGGDAFRPQNQRADNTFPSQHPRGRGDEAFRPPAAGRADIAAQPQRSPRQRQSGTAVAEDADAAFRPPQRSGAFELPQPQRLAEPEDAAVPVRRERVDFGSAPVSGRLPNEPAPRSRRERVAATAASLQRRADDEPTPQRAEDDEELLPFDSEADEAAENPADPPRRQRVTLRTPAARPCRREEEDEVRVYAAPAVDGLGTFDLGSVPASVTPPKSWRKAAWFATGASGAVVVGLLFAGTFLVGGPTTTTTTEALGGGWPGRQNGGNPLFIPDSPTGRHGGKTGETSSSSSSRQDSATDDPRTHPEAAGYGGATSDDATSSDPATGGSSSGPVTTGSSSRPPQKPPVTPAPRETEPQIYYTTPADTKKMGDNSEKFFNTVTTDPSQASAVTSGELHDKGAKGLRERYSDVAYFEVKKVTIDPDRNTTVNTVEVTHSDGSKTTEQRTLTFGDDGKITDDGA